MSQVSDVWFVRLPDGRVLRAATSQIVRYHLSAGRIPLDSRVRQTPEQEWLAIEWAAEFAEVVRARDGGKEGTATSLEGGDKRSPFEARVAARYDPLRLQTVGLRGLAEELLAALDNTLSRPKLLVAGVGGVLSALIVAIYGLMDHPEGQLDLWLQRGGFLLGILLIGVVANTLLTQLTYTELSQLRPATWKEARTGLVGFSFRLFLAFILAGGATIALIVLLRWLPGKMTAWNEAGWFKEFGTIPVETVGILAFLLEVILWPVLAFTLLLGPVIVIEESSVVRALGQWWWLIRRHLGKLFLYESAAMIGGLASLAFALPLLPAAWGRLPQGSMFDSPIGLTLCVFMGAAAAPLAAYFCVAHVFIYLNLRYETDRRDKA